MTFSQTSAPARVSVVVVGGGVVGCSVLYHLAKHQNDESADPLWDYFASVIEILERCMPTYYSVE